jgi:hypothetical protein
MVEILSRQHIAPPLASQSELCGHLSPLQASNRLLLAFAVPYRSDHTTRFERVASTVQAQSTKNIIQAAALNSKLKWFLAPATILKCDIKSRKSAAPPGGFSASASSDLSRLPQASSRPRLAPG